MKCYKCGAENKPQAKFCGVCGKIVVDELIAPFDAQKIFVFNSSSKNKIGPISAEQFLEMFRKGIIKDNDFIWGKENRWEKFSQVKKALFEAIPAFGESEVSPTQQLPPPFTHSKQSTPGHYKEASIENPPFTQETDSPTINAPSPNSIQTPPQPPQLTTLQSRHTDTYRSVPETNVIQLTAEYVKEKILNENASLVVGVLSMIISLYVLLTIFSPFTNAQLLLQPLSELGYEINLKMFLIFTGFSSLCSFVGWFLGFVGLLLAKSTRSMAMKYSVPKKGIALKGIIFSVIGLSTSIWCYIWIYIISVEFFQKL